MSIRESIGRGAAHRRGVASTAKAARPRPLEGDALGAVASTFRTLSDPTRLRILALLDEGESCVHDLCGRLAMNQPAVSHHLRTLRDTRLVRARRDGREVYYALDDRHVMDLVRLVAQARESAGHPRGRR
jgi:DNA-binding transcriptional ArsR family regulator